MTEGPRIERVRHELKRRRLTVARVERLAPKMLRVVLTGADLAGFISLGFDDHIKLFFPTEGGAQLGAAQASEARDFTPRRYDARAGELWVDFFLHEAGPAAAWAAQAAVGQTLEIGGPKGSSVIHLEGIDSHVFIGDETALPAIGRRLEELPAGARALVIAESGEGAANLMFKTAAELESVQVARARHEDAPAQHLIEALRKLPFPSGRCFVWVALESKAARAVRRYLCEERGIQKQWVKAAGYWQRGSAGSHEVISDVA